MASPTPNSTLSDVVVTTVKPARIMPHKESFHPTFFDLCNIDGFVPTISAYRLKNKADYTQIVDTLKKSLGEVLVHYYPMAGRWIRTFDTKMRQLLCNDKGVPFIEAFLDEELDLVIEIDDFQPVKYLSGHEFIGFDSKVFNQEGDEFPSLFVQVTRFKCGGLVLALNFNHMTLDGKGFYEFMNVWAGLARIGHTTIVPIHDRSAAQSFEAILPGFSDDATKKTLNGEDYGALYKHKHGVETAWKTLHVRKEAIEELKSAAKDSNGGEDEYVTTIDCISAHFSRIVTKLSTNLPTSLCTIMDGRNRFYEEPLPENFCGNVVMGLNLPPIPVEEPLLARARIIHDFVRAIKPSTWRSEALKALQEFGSGESQGFYISSWIRFPMYEVDFGFGRPFFACAMNLFPFRPMGYCVILPPAPSLQSAATVAIVTPKEILEAILADPDFRAFFL